MHCALEIRHACLIVSHFSLLIVCCRGNLRPIVFLFWICLFVCLLFLIIFYVKLVSTVDLYHQLTNFFFVSITWQVRKLPNNCLTLYCFPWFFLCCGNVVSSLALFFMATKKWLFIEIQFIGGSDLANSQFWGYCSTFWCWANG